LAPALLTIPFKYHATMDMPAPVRWPLIPIEAEAMKKKKKKKNGKASP
jgi:hypothetical protein